jgi:polysaccharide deacetylase 2 family uncharacterized protein YibQ
VAILIDDMGYRKKTGEEMLAIDMPLSFAFLPYAPFTEKLLATAHKQGRPIMLHQPLEATDQKWDPGPGTLTTKMDFYSLCTQFQKNLKTIPHAIGVNNHMGSYFTKDRAAMEKLLRIIQANNLFFLDSVTCAQSVGFELAQRMGIRSARRQVFLDNDQDPIKIKKQLDLLVHIARKNGEAIGIGHPYPSTVTALTMARQELLNTVELVFIEELMH